jgi:hypothetical protein
VKGEPIDPISYEEAINELWEKLATQKGFNLRKHLFEGADGQSPEEQLQAHVDDWLQGLRREADIRIMGLVMCGHLKAWLSDREEWSRPTERTLRERLMKFDDMPHGLAVDRQELEAIIATRWPQLASANTFKTSVASDAVRPTGRRGRPTGSGTYTESDGPLLLEMRALLKDGVALSIHAASLRVAERARGGGSLESKARRLRDAYAARWGKNG